VARLNIVSQTAADLETGFDLGRLDSRRYSKVLLMSTDEMDANSSDVVVRERREPVFAERHSTAVSESSKYHHVKIKALRDLAYIFVTFVSEVATRPLKPSSSTRNETEAQTRHQSHV